jgi:hypothetical protein
MTPPGTPGGQSGRDILAAYAQELPIGQPVRVVLSTGRTLRGTLMRADSQSLVIQENTRWPEPPVTVSLDTVALVDPAPRSNLGKAIFVGVATGAAAAVGVLLFLAAVLDD